MAEEMTHKKRETAKRRVRGEDSLDLTMEMTRKGTSPKRRERVLIGLPVGVQSGVLRKGNGAIFSPIPTPQMMEMTASRVTDEIRAMVTESSSLRVRIRFIEVKKRMTRERIVVVDPGSRKASTRLGVFKKVDNNQAAARVRKGRPKGERVIRTCLSATSEIDQRVREVRATVASSACLLNS